MLLLVARADSADQRQRRGRGAASGRRRDRRSGCGRSPCQLLLPLAFAAHAGSLLTLTGSPVNVIASRVRRRRRAPAASATSSSRSSACRSSPATIAIVVLFGERLLPAPHAARAVSPDFSAARPHAHRPVRRSTATRSCSRAARASPRSSSLRARSSIGERVFPGMVTESGDLVVLAVQRKGEELDGRDGARGRRHAAAAGNVGRARGAPRRPRRARRRRAGSSSGARPCRSAPARSARSPCSPRWSSCSRPAPCRRPSPACWPPARSSSGGC